MRWAVAVLVVGLLGAVVPALAAESGFLRNERIYSGEGSVLVPRSQSVGGTAGQPSFAYRVEGNAFAVTHNAGGITVHGSGRITVTIPGFPPRTSAVDLVQHDAGWAAAAAAIALAPLLFLWWRRDAVSFVRVAGIACALAASAAVCALVLTRLDREYLSLGWIWGNVPLGGALMAAAFLVAPAPRRRDDA